VTGIITNMVMPKIEREAEARNYANSQSPLEEATALTLGNACAAFSFSLEGNAISSIRIADVRMN